MKSGTNKKTSALILLGSMVVLVLGGVAFLIWYVNHISGQLAALEEEVAVQMAREKQADAVGHFLEDIGEEETLVSSFFIHRDNVLSAIQTLENLGPAVGGKITLAQVDVVGQTKDVPGTLSVRLTGSGSWSSMIQALALLEHLPFHAEISQIALGTGSGSTSGPATWSLQAVLTAALVQ